MKKAVLEGDMSLETLEPVEHALNIFSLLEDVIEVRKNAPIDARERLSIDAMITYRAHFLKCPEWIVIESLKALFDLDHVHDLRRRDFIGAVEYLVDLNVRLN